MQILPSLGGLQRHTILDQVVICVILILPHPSIHLCLCFNLVPRQEHQRPT